MPSMQEILEYAKLKGASDVHITAGSPPVVRLDGSLVLMPGEKLTPAQTQELTYSVLAEEQKQQFEASNELDTAITFKGVGRVRLNVFRQKNSVGAAFRFITESIATFEQLGLPPVVYRIAASPKGLILITGPTGSGKSTTLASFINYINENRYKHVITIEDPIEFIHAHKKSVINQREVGQDTNNFSNALRHILRQDPDVILIGELRDLETVQSALNIAETGHLVFATLHTNDAVQTINRIIDIFPSNQQAQVRIQLSFVLEAVLCQQLLVRGSGSGRVLSLEVLMVTPAVRNLVREAKTEQIQTHLQTGAKFGMQTMNQSLADLLKKRMITYETAVSSTSTPLDLKRLVGDAPPQQGGSFRNSSRDSA